MIARISKLVVADEYKLVVTFDDGKTVLYDVGEDIDSIPSYQQLRTVCGLFRQAQLDESRTCIFWNDEIDLPSDVVYEYGTEIVSAAGSMTSAC